MSQNFYSNGKLLITGEYLVLDGALALAVPTKLGQSLNVSKGTGEKILWKSFDSDGLLWFEEAIAFDAIIKKVTYGPEKHITNTLIAILHEAYLQNPDFITTGEGYQITTELTFPRLWGLGTSSTLINNIAQWTKTDAFTLLRNSFGGSGYDIACAKNDTPITYRLEKENAMIESVAFNPTFTDKMFFVYLNKKQSSKTAIANYTSKRNAIELEIARISEITKLLLTTNSFTDCSALLQEHEAIMSNILEQETVKKTLFPDFKGVIKSLGAWGGDFVLVLSEDNPSTYFKEKGYSTVIPYSDMIK